MLETQKYQGITLFVNISVHCHHYITVSNNHHTYSVLVVILYQHSKLFEKKIGGRLWPMNAKCKPLSRLMHFEASTLPLTMINLLPVKMCY